MVYKFFDKKSKASGLYLMNFINQLLESSKKETFTLLLRTLFGVLI